MQRGAEELQRRCRCRVLRRCRGADMVNGDAEAEVQRFRGQIWRMEMLKCRGAKVVHRCKYGGAEGQRCRL